ncbi:hypothetical protein [Mycolicibacterium sp. HK-90]|uniref:hypothetical protein n=1 Tax=Mycolicibacterium sp. HK-90 TaxID=3056937 RepID=UPI0026592DF0|nr:hypothetical protein [Mycolicibacterium sp. HK-90]WKG02337.1 hypothetical protein QU592_24445 [Mycolicibacterium sp. HK-90]
MDVFAQGVPVDWSQARPLLRPVLRPQSYVTATTQRDDPIWARQLWPLVSELAVVDLPDRRVVVTVAATERWGVTGLDAFAAARENLAARSPEVTPGQKVMLRDADGGTYVDALIVVDGWLSSLAVPGQGQPLVFMPGDGALLVGTDDPADAPGLFEAAERMYLDADRFISPQAYTIGDGTIVPLDLAGPHPMRHLALRARAVQATREYGSQTDFLQDHYEREMIPQYVGRVGAVETPWGVRTLSVWGKGAEWDLPETDYIMIGTNQDGSDLFTIPFGVLVDAIGLRPLPGPVPARYRTPPFPSVEILTELRAHAVDLPPSSVARTRT